MTKELEPSVSRNGDEDVVGGLFLGKRRDLTLVTPRNPLVTRVDNYLDARR